MSNNNFKLVIVSSNAAGDKTQTNGVDTKDMKVEIRYTDLCNNTVSDTCGNLIKALRTNKNRMKMIFNAQDINQDGSYDFFPIITEATALAPATAITSFTTINSGFWVDQTYNISLHIGSINTDPTTSIITDGPELLDVPTISVQDKSATISVQLNSHKLTITERECTITGKFWNTSTSLSTDNIMVVVNKDISLNGTKIVDTFTLNNDYLAGTNPNLQFINDNQYLVYARYSNTIGELGGSNEFKFYIRPTQMPALIESNKMLFMSNLELLDTSLGGATLFWDWPSNKSSLETANTASNKTIPNKVTVSYQEIVKDSKGDWVAQTATKKSRSIDISGVKVGNTYQYTSDALKLVKNGPLNMPFSYTWDAKDIPVGTAVQAQVVFENGFGGNQSGSLAVSNNVMAMSLPAPLDVKYVVDASDSNVTFYYDASNGTPQLNGGILQPIYKMTLNGNVSDISFNIAREFDTTKNLDITLGTYRSSLTLGQTSTFNFNTVTKSPFDISKSFVSLPRDATTYTIYGKGRVGRVQKIASYKLDSSNRPLVTVDGWKAFSVNFIPPALNTSLTGGIGGDPAKAKVKFHLYRNGAPQTDYKPIDYPAVAEQEQSWVIKDDTTFPDNFSVLVMVDDPQYTTRSYGKLPDAIPTTFDVSGQFSVSVSGESLTFVPKVQELTYDVSNQVVTWKDQTAKSLTDAKLLGLLVYNNVIVKDDYTGSILNPSVALSRFWASDSSLNNFDLSASSVVSNTKYSVFVVPEYRYEAKDLSNTTVNRFNVKLRDLTSVSSLSFIAGRAPSAPRNLRVTSEDKGLGVMWSDSSLNGGEFNQYDIAAVQAITTDAVDVPAFPINQASVISTKFSDSKFGISVTKAFETRKTGIDARSNILITPSSMKDDLSYNIAVRATSDFKPRTDVVVVPYELTDSSAVKLSLVSPTLTNQTVPGPWSIFSRAVQPMSPVDNATFTVSSSVGSIVVQFTPGKNADAYIMFIDGRAQPEIRYPNDTREIFSITVASSLVVSGKPVKIGFANVRLDKNSNDIIETSDLKDAIDKAVQVVPGTAANPGAPESIQFKVDTGKISVQYSAPTNTSSAGQEIILNFIKYKASALSYDISYSDAVLIAAPSTLSSDASGIWIDLPKVNQSQTYNVDIRAKYTIQKIGDSAATDLGGLQATYVSVWRRVNLTAPIRVGPAPVAGSIVDKSLKEDVSFNRISFQYKLPDRVANFPYDISNLTITDLSGETAFTATRTAGDISYNSVVTFEISNVLHGKEYNFQVAPVANYLFAQAPPATLVPKAVPFGKLNITGIQPLTGNPTSGYTAFTVTVDLNGDKLNDIILVSDPVGPGALEVKTMVGPSLPTITYSGSAKTSNGTAASPLIAANQTATFTVNVQTACVSLLLIANGKTSAIRNFPTNAPLTF